MNTEPNIEPNTELNTEPKSTHLAPLKQVDGMVIPIDRPNVDTDAIIPKQFMKSIRRTGFGDNLFDEWRYLDHGEPHQPVAGRPLNPASVFNETRYHGASIMLTRENFGCGSSREHAVWALHDYGIQALISSGFADIFKGNCLKNNLLPIELPSEQIDFLFKQTVSTPGYRLQISVQDQTVRTPDGQSFRFKLDSGAKLRLLEGLDEIALTLKSADRIQAYEARRAMTAPWLFPQR